MKREQVIKDAQFAADTVYKSMAEGAGHETAMVYTRSHGTRCLAIVISNLATQGKSVEEITFEVMQGLHEEIALIAKGFKKKGEGKA